MGQNVSSPKDENNEKELYLHKILRQREHIPFNVESWYKILENETFYTEFLPISPSIAQAFVNYYQARYNSKTSLFNTEHCKLIQSIENQLKEQIFNSKSKRFSTDGCFIRLSSRSPKDGNCLNQHMLKELYYQELNRLQETYPNEFDSTIQSQSNMEMIAFCSAQAHRLKVTNEQETLNLLLSSERVFVDLLDSLHCQKLDETYQWNNHLIIRQWNHQLDHSMEFRCFVHQSKLTAISQYNHYCKFYHLQNELIIEQIKSTIMKYFQEKIQFLFEKFNEIYSNYIIDISLIKNQLTNEFDCIVIEINPFHKTTGASLFNWTNDLDQLIGKQNQIEMRIRKDYYPNIQDLIEFIHQENKLKQEEDVSDDQQPYFVFFK